MNDRVALVPGGDRGSWRLPEQPAGHAARAGASAPSEGRTRASSWCPSGPDSEPGRRRSSGRSRRSGRAPCAKPVGRRRQRSPRRDRPARPRAVAARGRARGPPAEAEAAARPRGSPWAGPALPRLAGPRLGAARRGRGGRRDREQQAGADDEQGGSHGLVGSGITQRVLSVRRAARAGNVERPAVPGMRAAPGRSMRWGYSFVTQLLTRRHPWRATGTASTGATCTT